MSRLQQNSAQLITSARGPPEPNLVQIHPLGTSGHMGENVFVRFLFIYTFFETRVQVRPVDAFLRAIAH